MLCHIALCCFAPNSAPSHTLSLSSSLSLSLSLTLSFTFDDDHIQGVLVCVRERAGESVCEREEQGVCVWVLCCVVSGRVVE